MTVPRSAQRPDASSSAEPTSNGPVELVAGEQHIVARVRAGDEAAFVALFRSHYAALCEFATALTHASDQAEEIVQDLFAGIWERRATWAVRDSVRGYLFGAVRNRALNAIRNRQTETRWLETCAREGNVAALGYRPDATEASAVGDDTDAAIARAVARLPERCRLVYTLRWHHELSYAEIAETLGVAVKTVDAQLAKAMRILREEIARDR